MVKIKILALLLLISVQIYPNWNFRTPELFGDKSAIIFQNSSIVVGYVGEQDMSFVMIGSGDNNIFEGTFFQVSGRKPDNEGYANTPIKFKILIKNNSFKGWIFFRGHERPFCGAKMNRSFPNVCMLR